MAIEHHPRKHSSRQNLQLVQHLNVQPPLRKILCALYIQCIFEMAMNEF